LVKHITDPREATTVELIRFDLDVFKAWDGVPAGHAAPAYTYGGPPSDDQRRLQTSYAGGYANLYWVYFDVAPVASRERAIRIKNDGKITRVNADSGAPAPNTLTSLTPWNVLVMNCPLYIQGDYNTGRTNANTTTQPHSDITAGPRTEIFETPVVDPCSEGKDNELFISDAVTVLSNAWEDANSGLALSSRIASNTRVNVRFMAGDVPTNGTNNYSGGAENFIRLLEDWTGKYFTYNGQFDSALPQQNSRRDMGKTERICRAQAGSWSRRPILLLGRLYRVGHAG
jgi:hypothetical protein